MKTFVGIFLLFLAGVSSEPNYDRDIANLRDMLFNQSPQVNSVIADGNVQPYNNSVIHAIVSIIIEYLLEGLSNPLAVGSKDSHCELRPDCSYSINSTGIVIYGLNNATYRITLTPTGLTAVIVFQNLYIDRGTETEVKTSKYLSITTVTTGTQIITGTVLTLYLTVSGLIKITAISADLVFGHITSYLTCTVGGVDVSPWKNEFSEVYLGRVLTSQSGPINDHISERILDILYN